MNGRVEKNLALTAKSITGVRQLKSSKVLKKRWRNMSYYDMNYLKEIELAEQGDLYAMFNVASYIIWGDCSSKIEPEMAERALRYYNTCAEAGDTDSMLDLGGMYLLGRGVEKDVDTALALYHKAADSNAPKAFRCLGNYYKYDELDDGSPVPTADTERLRTALSWFEKGAQVHEENSLYELGDYYRYGICVDKDEARAFRLYCDAYEVIIEEVMQNTLSDNDSYSDVTLRLAECYHYGIGTDIDLDKAKKFIRIAKDECKRRLNEGDMYGGSSLPMAEREWLLIMQEAGF
jgi:hypothetical protein